MTEKNMSEQKYFLFTKKKLEEKRTKIEEK